MSETISHKRAKVNAPGKIEVPIKGGRRLDSATSKTATEVERNRQNLDKAASRLKASGRPNRVLQVPQPLMKDAAKAMRNKGLSGSVKNISGTRRIAVRKKQPFLLNKWQGGSLFWPAIFLLKIYLRSHNPPYLIMAFNHTHSIKISPNNKRGTLVPKQLTTIKPILVIKKLNL